MYDPHAHATDMGVKIVHRPIGKETGLWVPRYNAIFLRPGMTARHERSVLAHEVAHATLKHSATSRREEAAADQLAAYKLIDHDRLVSAFKWSSHIPEIAVELWVTDHILRTYLRSPKWQDRP